MGITHFYSAHMEILATYEGIYLSRMIWCSFIILSFLFYTVNAS
jgi:hypothetical protein